MNVQDSKQKNLDFLTQLAVNTACREFMQAELRRYIFTGIDLNLPPSNGPFCLLLYTTRRAHDVYDDMVDVLPCVTKLLNTTIEARLERVPGLTSVADYVDQKSGFLVHRQFEGDPEKCFFYDNRNLVNVDHEHVKFMLMYLLVKFWWNKWHLTHYVPIQINGSPSFNSQHFMMFDRKQSQTMTFKVDLKPETVTQQTIDQKKKSFRKTKKDTVLNDCKTKHSSDLKDIFIETDPFLHKQWFVVNSSLRMKTGKIAGQCAHASAAWARRLAAQSTQAYEKWLAEFEPKIILCAQEEHLVKLLEKYPNRTIGIRDAGKTQIKPGSLTVVGFEPCHVSDKPSELERPLFTLL
jgi:peptidyl-tRNA hydrolase